jgi:hypothetical protein
MLTGTRSVPGAADDTADPVFVMCMARSGSTLLRLILDSHPELACPPETGLPGLCAQLTILWSLIEGAPLAPGRGDNPPVVPETAVDRVRAIANEMLHAYLARRGRRVYCDKTLGSAQYSELLHRVWPTARYVCLYRHPMDFIHSALEATPWGLSGYGFEQYAAGSPGNGVFSLARYWSDNAAAILQLEELMPGQCFRVRYEDLVSAPEEVTAAVFDFLGVSPAPGISKQCFEAEHERFGPADHKIWHTSAITADSIGSGTAVPAGLIPPGLAASINEQLDRLGYLKIDETWGTPAMPSELFSPGPYLASRLPAPGPSPACPDGPAEGDKMLDEHLRTGLDRIDDQFRKRWGSCAGELFTVVSARHPADDGALSWHINMPGKEIVAGQDRGNDDDHWNIIGAPEVWKAILSGELNLSVALRQCTVRYCDTGEDIPFLTELRIAMFADLLGLTLVGTVGRPTGLLDGAPLNTTAPAG